MKQLFLLSVAVLTINTVKAQDYLLKGTLGRSTVVVDLIVSGGDAEVTYFYSTTCTDITLRGLKTSGGIAVYATHRSFLVGKNYDTSESIILKQNPDKSWTGTWADKKGKKQPMLLAPLDVATIKHPFADLPVVRQFKATEPYEFVRSYMLPVDRDANPTNKGKLKFKYIKLRGTSVKLLFLTEGLESAMMAKVNNMMINKFIEFACSYCSCAANIGAPSYEYNIENLYLSENILSVYVTFQYFCKGEPHADGGEEPINIDLKTGEELELEDLLYLSKVAVPEPGSAKWFAYREKVYAPQLVALLQGLHPKQMAYKEDCNYNGVKLWVNPEWYINDKGLYISPVFPREIAPCRNPEWSFVPFKVVNERKNPGKKIVLP
ncbi:hypothetical protein [Flavipsychrobacter stenotrophus]|uniref:hypothetical protein n=1 Tax=Flavipsychrobacter stenotrophus TaxID=2077091 RepID=UPI001056F3CD|nr:hypothetical protein [Flavipsychrobacter stenotrophus]